MTQAKKKWRLSPAISKCYVGEIMIPSQLLTFSEFIWNAFMSYGSRFYVLRQMDQYVRRRGTGRPTIQYDNSGSKQSWVHRWTIRPSQWCGAVIVRNFDTSKVIVNFVHEVHQVFVITLSTFWNMLCGWNDDTMPTFNLFRVHFEMLSNFRVI